MILTSLNQYYDHLQASPDPFSGLAKVPPYGFTEERIDYVLVLSQTGDVIEVIPNTITDGEKTRSKPLSVPASFKRPGKYTEKAYKSGKDNAFFLWDKSAYSLGVDLNKDKNSVEITNLYFNSFKRFNSHVLISSNDQGHVAFLGFLNKWDPNKYDEFVFTTEILGANIVFQLEGDKCYLHDREASKFLWVNYLSNTLYSSERRCLVTGQKAKLARLHPAIKGINGGQSSGGSIVAFNADAYESYGKTQGENAPVSELAAFKYTTALNYLLKRDNKHCLTVGDASTVFWAIAKDAVQSQKAESLFIQTISPSDDAEAAQLNPVMEKIARGKPIQEIAPDIDPNTSFFILGLAPNAARISIRFWLQSSFGELAKRLSEHYTDLALDPLPWKQHPSVWRLLAQLAPYRKGQKSKGEDIPAHLAGEVMRSILTGNRYPHAMLSQLLTRFRTDGHISALRVAMVKAVLQRDYRHQLNKEEIPVALDEYNDNEAYLLGRLFAVLERIQSSAIKEANATITDRYFASASTVPYSVFPRLIAGSKHHLSKLRKDRPGQAVNLDKDLSKIFSKLPSMFPKHFSIDNQGRFAIGYYQQREKYFSSKDVGNTQTNPDSEE